MWLLHDFYAVRPSTYFHLTRFDASDYLKFSYITCIRAKHQQVVPAHTMHYFRILLHIICAAGCLYHIYSVSSHYFKFQTSIAIHTNIPEHAEVPPMTNCFYDVLLLRKSQFTGRQLKAAETI